MKLPKGKLLTLLAVFAAVGLVTATGAFTTVTAERTATVNVAGDNSALLGLSPYSGPDSTANTNEYLSSTGSGNTLAIDMTGDSSAKVNLDAQTGVENVFNITNQGSQAVAVNITTLDNDASDGGEASTVRFAVHDNDLDNPQGGSDIAWANANVQRISNNTDAVVLQPGETIAVSMYIDTTGGFGPKVTDSSEDLLEDIEISADADAVGGSNDLNAKSSS